MTLAANILDDRTGFARFARSFHDTARGPADAAPPTASAWKLDAMAIGALVVGAVVAFALRRGGI